MNIKKITSIFVEGITDVALYRAFLMYGFSYSTLKEEEEEFVKEDLLKKQIETKLLPPEQARLLKKNGHLVIIQAKCNNSELKKFCNEIKSAIVRIKRKIESTSFNVKSFFVFDDELPEDCNSNEFPEFIEVVHQQTPEKVIWALLDQFLEKRGDIKYIFQKVEHCLKIIESETKNTLKGNVDKRRINFLKSIVGERCHDHLLRELLKGTDLAFEMAKLLPENIVKRFSEESND
jgi:hypothetical protein